MTSSRKGRRGQGSAGSSGSTRCRTSPSGAKTRGKTGSRSPNSGKTRSPGDRITAYAAAWLENYNDTFGVFKVFRERGKCLDFLVDTVFERAKILKVEVVDIGGKLEERDGCTCYPLMTREQVRDQLGSGMDFSLVLEYDGYMSALDHVTMGIREVDVE